MDNNQRPRGPGFEPRWNFVDENNEIFEAWLARLPHGARAIRGMGRVMGPPARAPEVPHVRTPPPKVGRRPAYTPSKDAS